MTSQQKTQENPLYSSDRKISFTPVKGIHVNNGENVCAIYVT